MNTSIKNLNQVLAFQLEGMYDVVKELQSELSRSLKLIDDQELRLTVSAYRQNLGDQRLKLKRMFGYLLSGPYGRSVSTDHLQVSEVADLDIIPKLRDVVLVSSLHSTIRYFITCYTDARYIAMRLELDSVVKMLDEIVESEEEFCQKLRFFSVAGVNQACLLATV